MKLVRHGPAGAEKPALWAGDGGLRDLSGVIGDIAGEVLSDAGLDRLRAIDPASLPPVRGQPRIGPCVGGSGRVICVAANYVRQGGVAAESELVLLDRAAAGLGGADDPLVLPGRPVRSDWQVCLAVIIGSRAQGVTEAAALAHVAGYAVMNDPGGGAAGAPAALGPWLVTRDEVPDPQDLPLWLNLNGQRAQSSTTRNMVLGVAALISRISARMVLEPGDVIATGTPPGAGRHRVPPRYLRAGDALLLGIGGLGRQQQVVKPARRKT